MLSFLCILCIFRSIKLPAVQCAANKHGGRRGGCGGRNGRGSNARGHGNGRAKGGTPKQEEETIEDEDKEPLGDIPETIEDDILKRKKKDKEANDKPKRGQTAKRGKPFKMVKPSTHKLEEMKNCSVSLERKNKEATWLYAELFSVITITDSHDKIFTTSGLFFSNSTKGVVKIKIYITFTPHVVKIQINTML